MAINSSYDKISPTAWATAHARTFTDIPYSKEIFSLLEKKRNELGQSELSTKMKEPSLTIIMEGRYKMADKVLKELKATQILEVASGLVQRGLILSENPNITYVEFDLPAIMSVKITYFVHGTTVDNKAHISSGWKDVELSELGIRQSEELTEQTKDMKFDAIFTSDLKRAVDSAKITWGSSNIPIFHDKRLRECNYGDYNGKPSEDVEPLQEKSITIPMPNGESYEDVKNRVSDFLEDLRSKYNGCHIAIVGHKAPQLALEVLLRGKSWESAFARDWRKVGKWQAGWEYIVGDNN